MSLIGKMMSILFPLKEVRKHIETNDFKMAYQHYLYYLYFSGEYNSGVEQLLLGNISDNMPSKIAVSSWDFSHNAVGRATTLFNLYQYAQYDVDLIGCMIQNNTKNHKKVWQPLNDSQIIYNFFEINQADIDDLLPKAVDFVIKNPYSIVHLSKPRITNVVLGILYRYIWGTKIILDIDDEELSFLKEKNNFEYSNNIKDDYWTNYSVSLYDIFDAVTVSNPALQHKYGGAIIPHIRNEKIFYPNQTLKAQNREKYGINQTDKVVLFFGTPKRHKGLLETAKAISQIGREELLFLIVGDFPELGLKEELLTIENVRYMFLPNQPYDQAKNIVAMGDMCILMQDEHSETAKYQLPAKLIDALAMGLTVFLQKTPATEHLMSASNIYFVNQDNLSGCINHYLQKKDDSQHQASQYQYFLENFSAKTYSPVIDRIINDLNILSYDPKKSFDFIRELNGVGGIKNFLERFGKNEI